VTGYTAPMPTAPRKRLFGFVVPGAIVGLLFASSCIPYPGDMVAVIWISVACVLLGAEAGAFWDFVWERIK
jgi:hypothetical protein